jgi:hypothetical protein
MKRLIQVILLIGVGMALGAWLSSQGPRGRTPELEQARLLKNVRPCAEPTTEESKTYSLAADVLEQNLRTRALWLDIGVEKFLAHGLYREATEKGMSVSVCAPENIYSRAGQGHYATSWA